MSQVAELDRIRAALGIRESTCVWSTDGRWLCGLYEEQGDDEIELEWDSVEEATQVILHYDGPRRLTWVYPWETPSVEVMNERIRYLMEELALND